MFQVKAKVIKNIAVRQKYYKIILSCPRIAKIAQPGQFLQVKVSDADEPLLRRPFSIHRVRGQGSGDRGQEGKVNLGIIELLYEIKGRGTEILARKKAGEYLDIIGPLGNGFDYRMAYGVRRTALLVAGGMGIAPLIFLAEKLCQHGTPYSVRRTIALIGAKTKNQILCERDFKQLGCEVKIATDDGSVGFKGRVTDLLKSILRRTPYTVRRTQIYTCGPRPMLKEASRISKKYNIPAQISLEEHMACGIGACLGCVVKARYAVRGTPYKFQYKRVCKEGPVFNADEIVW